MLIALRYLLAYLARLVFSLRYRVRVDGLDRVRDLHRALILPNHPAYMDPPLVLSALWPALRPRPMLFEDVFNNPVLFWLPRVLGAVKLPNLEQHSTSAREQTQATIQAVVDGLRRGENFILWPSGRVQRQNTESLGAARSLAEILAAVPDAQVVAVRTRGLWGSMFSFARTGQKPPLVKTLFKGLGVLAANLLFFSPRREVRISVERFEPQALPGRTREQLNPFFENWYNAPGPETPTYVPYHFLLGPREFAYPAIGKGPRVQAAQFKPEIRADVAQMVEEKLKRPLREQDQRPEVTLESLGLDSLDRMELSIAVEGRFGFRSDEVPNTIGELWALAAGLVEHAPPKPAPPEWFQEPRGDVKLQLLGDTIADAFVRRALLCADDVAAADDVSGVLTYERLLIRARVIAGKLRQIEAANVGLMMPASVAGDLVFVAMHLAGKLPVVMNWTTGPANLAHAARTMQLTHVVTSRQFIDRTGISIEGVSYVYLEEIRKAVGKLGLLRELMWVKWGRLKGTGIREQGTDAPTGGSLILDPSSPFPRNAAVVLFTSGSEKAPKAVPLSHRNLLSNLQSVLDAYDLSRRDSMIGFLPIFHSFGLTVTTLLPILTGVRVVHHPDPTDAGGLAHKIAGYRPTVLAGTPTFVNYIIDKSKPQDLASLRLVVVGAEKCPEELARRARELAPHAHVLEGYGITECSPMVSANRVEWNRPGTIGQPLPGVSVRAVHPETYAPVAENERGMLLVSGPNVFDGYITPADAEAPPTPFVELDGQRWYITGDLASIDRDGFIRFAGRLKRFIKAGGEMISLPAIEEPIAQRYPPGEEGPRVAIEGVELPGGGRRIVLFTTESLSVADANELLTSNGLRGVMRIDEVRRVERIPVLGTGKTDYKALRAIILDEQGLLPGR